MDNGEFPMAKPYDETGEFIIQDGKMKSASWWPETVIT
jgi:hypothetical protein